MLLSIYRRGRCVGFFLSRRHRTQDFRVFFEQIKNKRCDGKPFFTNAFMSDRENAFYEAWKAEMGEAKQKLLCAYHVIDNWNSHLNKITSNDLVKKTELELHRENIRKMLRELRTETLQESHEQKYSKLKSYLDTHGQQHARIKEFNS